MAGITQNEQKHLIFPLDSQVRTKMTEKDEQEKNYENG